MTGHQPGGKRLTLGSRTLEPTTRVLAIFRQALRKQTGKRVGRIGVRLFSRGSQPPARRRYRDVSTQTICVDESEQIFALNVAMLGTELQLAERRAELLRA